jgi:hypothetical protein
MAGLRAGTGPRGKPVNRLTGPRGLPAEKRRGEMTYHTLIVDPLHQMVVQVGGFIPTLVTAFGIMIIGWIAASFLRKAMVHLLGLVEFDKVADKTGFTRFLRTGGIRRKPGETAGCVVYCLFMVMVLILTVKALGFSAGADLVDRLLAYVPGVITGAVVLIIGMYLARFVSVLVYIAAKNTDMPAAATLARLSKFAIMGYVTILYLTEIGFVALFKGEHYTIFMAGVVFALALAFGLAGKEVAAKYLGVFKPEKTAH